MLLASLAGEVLAYTAPVLFGLRQWRAATWQDPAHYELDPVG